MRPCPFVENVRPVSILVENGVGRKHPRYFVGLRQRTHQPIFSYDAGLACRFTQRRLVEILQKYINLLPGYQVFEASLLEKLPCMKAGPTDCTTSAKPSKEQQKMNYISRISRLFLLAALVLSLAFVPPVAQATNSNAATVSISLTVGESLTLTATPASITFPGAGGAASAPIVVTTSANFAAGHYTTLSSYAWFSNNAAALVGPQNIPPTMISSSDNGHTANACTGDGSAAGVGIGGAFCYDVGSGTLGAGHDALSRITVSAGGTFTIVDSVQLVLGLPAGIVAGSYSGTINFQAVAV